MCEVGDIILVPRFISQNREVPPHSFVVLNVDGGEIKGLDYDLVCNMMSSFKNEEQKKRKLSYPGNFAITHNDSEVVNGNNKDGYIKADQFYYFDKSKTEFIVIGNMIREVFEALKKFIMESDFELLDIIDNLLDNTASGA